MKIVVVGGGVLGASTAYQLAKRGCAVELFERGEPGGEASAASLAWLNANAKPQRSYHDLNVVSMAEHLAVARELRNDSWLRRGGNIEVAGTDEAAHALRAKVARLHEYGYAAIELEPQDLPRYDPVVRVHEDYRTAVFYPGETWADLPLLVHELLRAATAHGAVVHARTEVARLLVESGEVTGIVLGDGSHVRADRVVLAAGSRIGALMRGVGIEMSTAGEPGATVVTAPGTSALSVLLHLPGVVVRPDAGGRLAVRSTQADRSLDTATWTLPQETVTDLIRRAAHGLSDVDAASTRGERISVAVRPYPVDGLPVVGFWPGVPGLYLITMHSGATLAAVTSRLAAAELVGGTPSALLDGFRPDRLTTPRPPTPAFDPHAAEAET
ncbi:NAD(P)/FAD-dependent oxidoreductase [Pseudonocardia sp. CA-107938]|uniref:NAD(P)/FAD-dependent oxidoreductase n=1 Tax=Pseudonocardia sp. CA-107938 TaxID=3240021 RepID=UPI003D9078AB